MQNKSATDLRNFEMNIASLFNDRKIAHPIHLSDGNEDFLINIFSDIQSNDWVFSTWRSHYHCLLKGVPDAELERAILNGYSISLNFLSIEFFRRRLLVDRYLMLLELQCQ